MSVITVPHPLCLSLTVRLWGVVLWLDVQLRSDERGKINGQNKINKPKQTGLLLLCLVKVLLLEIPPAPRY